MNPESLSSSPSPPVRSPEPPVPADAEAPVATAPAAVESADAAPPAPTKVSLSVAEIEAASAAIDFHLLVLEDGATTTYTEDTTEIMVGPPTWFALAPLEPTTRRYLYVLQKDESTGLIVLLQMMDGAGAVRVPPANGWLRAVVEGTLHLIGSELLLNREDFVALIGGHQGSPGSAKPPFV